MGTHAKLPTSTAASELKRSEPRGGLRSRTSESQSIAAAKAKAHFLRLLDEVESSRRSITITKRGRIVAQLVPAHAEQARPAFEQVFGSMKGSVKILGDIVSPDYESWGSEWR